MAKKEIFPSEDQEQIALIDWARLHPIVGRFIYHPPNGGSRNTLEALKLKRMGTKAGVSDLHLPYPCNGYPGLWIELKSRKKWAKPTKEQLAWLDLMGSVGFKVAVCYGWEQARNVILAYLRTSEIDL